MRNTVFSCDVCKKVFSSKGNLSKHISLHKPRASLTCNVCSKSFAERGNLKKHMIIHDKMKENYKCSVCHKLFLSNARLEKHMNFHYKEMTLLYTCTVPAELAVDEVCVTPEILLEAKVEYQCPKCNMVFHEYALLRKHRKTHMLKRKPISCDVCNKVIHGSDNFARHKATHIGQKHFQCDTCSKFFARRDILKSHMKTHIFSWDCTSCEKRNFESKKELLNHIDEEHRQMDKEEKKCKICGVKFKTVNSLRRHMHLHSDNEAKFKYICEICEKKHYRKDQYIRHLKFCKGKKVDPETRVNRSKAKETGVSSTKENDVQAAEENKTTCEKKKYGKDGNNQIFKSHKRAKIKKVILENDKEEEDEASKMTEADKEIIKGESDEEDQKESEVKEAETEITIIENDSSPKQKSSSEISKTLKTKRKADDSSKTTVNTFDKLALLNDGESSYKCDICEKEFNRKSKLEQHIHRHDVPCNRCNVTFTLKDKISVAMNEHGTMVYVCQECAKKHVDQVKSPKASYPDQFFKCSKCKKEFNSKGNLTKHLYRHRKNQLQVSD